MMQDVANGFRAQKLVSCMLTPSVHECLESAASFGTMQQITANIDMASSQAGDHSQAITDD